MPLLWYVQGTRKKTDSRRDRMESWRSLDVSNSTVTKNWFRPWSVLMKYSSLAPSILTRVWNLGNAHLRSGSWLFNRILTEGEPVCLFDVTSHLEKIASSINRDQIEKYSSPALQNASRNRPNARVNYRSSPASSNTPTTSYSSTPSSSTPGSYSSSTPSDYTPPLNYTSSPYISSPNRTPPCEDYLAPLDRAPSGSHYNDRMRHSATLSRKRSSDNLSSYQSTKRVKH